MKNLCDRAVLLEKGRLVKDGPPEEVLDYYNAVIAMREASYAIQASREVGASGKAQVRSGNGEASIQYVKCFKGAQETHAVQVGDVIDLAVGVMLHAPVVRPTVGILLKDRLGNDVFGTNTHHLGGSPESLPIGVPYEFRFTLPVNLGVGHYSLTVAVHAGETHVQGNYDWWEHAHTLQVVPGSQPSFIGSAYLPVSVSLGLSPATVPIATESRESHA